MIRRLFSVLLLAGCSIVHLHAQQPVASPDSLSADSIVYTGSTGQVYQLSETAYKKIHAKLEEEVKKELQLEFFKKVKNAHVLVEEKGGDYFVGYSENYIKCYISSKEDLIGKILPVKIGKPYGEGVYAKIGQQKSKKS